MDFDLKSLRSRPWKSALSNGWAVFKDLLAKLAESRDTFNQENQTNSADFDIAVFVFIGEEQNDREKEDADVAGQITIAY